MKIFITGGTGFIGSHILSLLGKTKHKVIALRRAGSVPCINITKEPVWLEKEMEQLEASDFNGVDVIVHLASVGVSPKVASWHELLHWNVVVMLDLMSKANAAKVNRFVLAGSYIEYGLSADKYDFIPTDAPLLPTSPYAASKAAGFIAANTFAIEEQIELCYLRIFSAFGDGQYINNFWPSLRKAALKGEDFLMTPGGQIRDFIHVSQVADSFLQTIENGNLVQAGSPLVANIGTGYPMSVLDFAKKHWAEWGAKGKIVAGAIPYRPNEPMRFVPQITKIVV